MTAARDLRRVVASAIAATVLAVAVVSCSGAPSRLDSADLDRDAGYISGDGTVRTWAPNERSEPIDFSGPDEEGELVLASDFRGKVLLLNFWYASCPPCRAEAPDLQELFERHGGDDVAFLGVNVRDSAGTSLSFSKEFGIGYPSILDAAEGEVSLALSGEFQANAVPTTLLIDREGRVAARVVGKITSQSVIDGLISDLLAEPVP